MIGHKAAWTHSLRQCARAVRSHQPRGLRLDPEVDILPAVVPRRETCQLYRLPADSTDRS